MEYKINFNPEEYPIGSLLTAEVISSSKNVKITCCNPKPWKFSSNIQLFYGDKLICEDDCGVGRYLARKFDQNLYGGEDLINRTQVDSWISFSLGPLSVFNTSIEDPLNHLNKSLASKTFLVAKQLTLADIYVFGSLYNRFSSQISSKYSHVYRWFKFIKTQAQAEKVLAQMKPRKPVGQAQSANKSGKNSKETEKSTEQIQKDGAKAKAGRKQEGKFDELAGAEMGKVVVRFPPEASGYLHIGHAKAALLNQYYAQTYKGKLIMRFDDTNPAKEDVEFEQAILEDLKLLEIEPDKFTHSSDYFEMMQNYCETLIRDGNAFVDDTPADLMKQERDQKSPSKNRDNSIEKNLQLWEEMKNGSEKGTQCCVRAKINYESVNGCMRDPTIYRCKPEAHPRTGNKFKVYPTYDFACPIVDSIEGVTHTLRTTEYHDRDEQFYWFIEKLKLKNQPKIWSYSRLNMTHTVLSKRKLTWFVQEGLVDGWDDPRFPTVRGILRRGMTVEALKQFIIAQGASKSIVFMEWDKIWAFNKKVIEPIAIRYSSLEADNLVEVRIEGAKEEIIQVQNHPKDPTLGVKNIKVGPKVLIEKVDADLLKEGHNTTFVNWGNILIKEIKRDFHGKIVLINAKLNLDDKNYKNTVKITWLAADGEKNNLIPCYAVYFEHIINKPVLGKDEDFKNYVTKDSKKPVKLVGEPELARVKKGEIIQLLRKGFFRCDVEYTPLSDFSSRERPLVLFHIPDGHISSVSSSSSSVSTQQSSTTPVTKSQSSSQTVEDINRKIVEQGNRVRDLKSQKADKKLIEAEVKSLLSLKSEYKTLAGTDWKPTASVPSAPTVTVKHQDQSTSPEDINQKIIDQGDKVRQLKAQKADKSKIDVEVKTLLQLKGDFKTATGQDWKPGVVIAKKEVDNKSSSLSVEKDSSKNMDSEILNKKIAEQGDKVRQLKAQKVDKSQIDAEVKTLLQLKGDFKTVTGQDWKPANSGKLEVTSKKEKSAGKVASDQKKDKQKEKPKVDVEPVKTGTRLGLEAKKLVNLPDWYSQVITKGEMIEYYDVSGCYILRPWSYTIWDIIKDFFDKEIKKLGVQNCYFPIFVSKAALEREKTHIADFAPEVAWVTKSGDSELAEPIAIRPTSETVMYPAYAKWVKSHRDLPLKLNQWNNVVRWEFKHPQPFLRTREFLWQEGHSAFMTKNEADKEVLEILELYARIYEEFLAIPVVRGRKTEKEKFAGGDYTTTVEAFISASGRAIQGATSHHLGQNFSKMFDIQVETGEEGSEKTFVFQNSWGITTRTIGVMVMVHGDDKGLVLPPKVASVQAVIVPCGVTASTTAEQREMLMKECSKLEEELKRDENLKVKGDYRDNYSPGWKFNHWELKGVPIRVELGFKDLEKNQVTLVRRDTAERATVPRSKILSEINKLLDTIQNSLYQKADKEFKEHIKLCEKWSQFTTELDKKNLLLAPFCGEITCEDQIKADSAKDDPDEPNAPSMGAKGLCIPFDQPKTPNIKTLKCIHPTCNQPAQFFTLFGRSY